MYLFTLGFVPDELLDRLCGLVSRFVELVFRQFHVSVAAPDRAAPPFTVAFFYLWNGQY